jgi:glycosyltransferase involved in cell wall biosynthesis
VVDSDDWEGPGGWNDNPATGYSEGQKRFFTWQEKYGLAHADAWTVTSECLRDRAIGLGARPQDVHVLHNGVDTLEEDARNQDSPTPEGRRNQISDSGQIVLYTRFAGVQPDDVIDIWRRVRELRGDAHLTVVGRGNRGEEAQLRGVPGIEVAGWLGPDAIREVLGRAAVAIAPWRNNATNRARHSAKVLDLMQDGVPVVAYDVGEMAVTLGDGGVLVEPEDASAFAAAVVGLLDDSERRRVMGMIGRERVRMLFGWDALAEVALTAYSVGLGG